MSSNFNLWELQTEIFEQYDFKKICIPICENTNDEIFNILQVGYDDPVGSDTSSLGSHAGDV